MAVITGFGVSGVVGVSRAIFFPVVGVLVTGLTDAVAGWICVDIAADPAGAIESVWVEKFNVSCRTAVPRNDM